MDHAGEVPTVVRVAGWLLVLVGIANFALGAAGLTVASDEVGVGAAVGLVVAGAVTTLGGRLVTRGSRVALYVALAVFEALLIVRLLTLGDGGASGPSLAVLVVLNVLLFVAVVQVRRARPT